VRPGGPAKPAARKRAWSHAVFFVYFVTFVAFVVKALLCGLCELRG